MKAAIWKYSYMVDKSYCRTIEFEMPKGAQILSVQNQRGEICIWALVGVKAPKVTRRFLDIGTGHEVHPDDFLDTGRVRKYIGTVQFFDGLLVRHFFDLGEV